MYLLYVAWADQRHRQCCIRHTEQIFNGTVLCDGRRGRTFAFPRFGELTSNQESHKTLLQVASTRSRARKSARTLAQFLTGLCCMRRGRPNLRFSKVWRTQQRVRQPGEPQDAFASCFNPLASAKIGRSILTLAACGVRLA